MEKIVEILKQTLRIYSQDIGMEFGIDKEAMLIMKSGKNTLQNELSHQIKRKSKENLQILGNIESWHLQTNGNEKKFKRVSQENTKAIGDKTI